MKTEIFVNPNYSYLSDFIHQIPEDFGQTGRAVHVGRNEVREVSVDGLRLIAKYFKRITWANRLIFATIRKSKARRAYEHSMRLLSNGITSPTPVAYINSYKNGLLYQSYYISLFTNYQPVSELFSLPIAECEMALKAFARFTYRLHQLGVYHDDYTLRNVLYSFDGGEFDFSLIDNNRMRFERYTYRKGLKNLQRLRLPVEKMGIVGAEYARAAHASDLKTLNGMIFFRFQYLLKISMKKWFKSLVHHHPKKVTQPHGCVAE